MTNSGDLHYFCLGVKRALKQEKDQQWCQNINKAHIAICHPMTKTMKISQLLLIYCIIYLVN